MPGVRTEVEVEVGAGKKVVLGSLAGAVTVTVSISGTILLVELSCGVVKTGFTEETIRRGRSDLGYHGKYRKVERSGR